EHRDRVADIARRRQVERDPDFSGRPARICYRDDPGDVLDVSAHPGHHGRCAEPATKARDAQMLGHPRILPEIQNAARYAAVSPTRVRRSGEPPLMIPESCRYGN